MEVRVKKICPQAKLPKYSHAGDAGLDLYSVVEEKLAPGEIKAISTGIKMAIPPGYVGLIWDKSGLSLEGIHRLAGVVDAGYRGEIKEVLVHRGNSEFQVAAGMKIDQ
ncbi:MAG: dUTP diphosphatase, partial [Candidatus Aminicenantes bacterium]